MSGEICLARTPCYLEMISVFGWDNLTENLWDFGNNNDGSRIKWGVLETTSQHFEILLTYKLLFIHPPALLNPSKPPAKWHWVCEDIKKKERKKISKKPQFYNHLHFLKDSSRKCSTPAVVQVIVVSEVILWQMRNIATQSQCKSIFQGLSPSCVCVSDDIGVEALGPMRWSSFPLMCFERAVELHAGMRLTFSFSPSDTCFCQMAHTATLLKN